MTLQIVKVTGINREPVCAEMSLFAGRVCVVVSEPQRRSIKKEFGRASSVSRRLYMV